MRETDGRITSEGDGYTNEEVLFTYSEEEKQQHEMNKTNAALVLRPEYLTIDYRMLHSGYSWYECAIFGFIKFFLSNNERFYCSNEQLADMLNIGVRSVASAIEKLQKQKLIKSKTRIRAGGGKIRFIELKANYDNGFKGDQYNVGYTPKCKICTSEMQNPHYIYNNIIEDKRSISKDIDNIYSPKTKNELSVKQNFSLSNPQPLGPLSPEADYFIKHSYEMFPSIKYQIDKNPQKYLDDLQKDYIKLCKDYGEETIKTVLNFIKQDDFRSKQIQSIGKLRKKNKDGVPYIVVMIEKIQQYKPKIIDLDNM